MQIAPLMLDGLAVLNGLPMAMTGQALLWPRASDLAQRNRKRPKGRSRQLVFAGTFVAAFIAAAAHYSTETAKAQQEPAAVAQKNIQETILKQTPAGTKVEFRYAAIVGDYAIQAWLNMTYDVGQQALLKRDGNQNKWTVVAVEGGAWSVSDLVKLGLPKDTASALLAAAAETSKRSYSSRDKDGSGTATANCRLVNDVPDRGDDVRWFGECADGLAHGIGVAKWYKDGTLNYEQEYLRTNGLIRDRGEPRAVPEVIDENISLKLETCNSFANFRYVHINATPSLALYNRTVVSYILNMRAQHFAWQQCPGRVYSNVTVGIDSAGRTVIRARSYDPVPGPSAPYKTNWAELSNDVLSERLQKYDQAYATEINARLHRQAEELRRQEKLEKQRIAQVRQERRAGFLAKFSAQRLINEEMLTVNPFLYKDQVVGVHTTFGRMISANEALFYHDGVGARAILVTGVPSTQFAGPKPVVLAIRVLGTKTTKTPGGEAILPHGHYIGVFECQNTRCDEFYDY